MPKLHFRPLNLSWVGILFKNYNFWVCALTKNIKYELVYGSQAEKV